MRTIAGRLFAHRPIRRSIALSFELLFVLPAAVLALVLAWRSVEQTGAQLEARLSDNARAVANATEDYLSRHRQSVRLLATVLSDAAVDSGRTQRLLSRHLQTFDGLLSAAATDASGTIVALALAERLRSTAPAVESLIGSSVADRDYFSSVAASGSPYESDAFEGRGIGDDWLVAMSAPIRDATRRFGGVAQVSLDLSRLDDLWEVHRRIEGEHLAIVDQRGQLVYSTLSEERTPAWLQAMLAVHDGDSMVARAALPLDGEHQEHLVAGNRLGNGWHAVVSLPAAHLQGVVWDELQQVCLFLALVVVVSGFAARVISRRITEPLEHLAEYVHGVDLSTGWQPEDPIADPPAEVDDVLRRFNELAIRLTASMDELRRVNAVESTLRHELEAVVNDREAEIRRRTEELEERTAELARAAEAATAADRAKSEFLANMSHEMRSPLTAVIGFTESILDDADAPADVADRLDIVLANSRHLLQLIGDILDLSKIEAGEMVLEWQDVDVAALLAELCSSQAAAARAKGLAFELAAELPVPRLIRADVTRLKQILFNLISNAIKFTAEGQITLHACWDQQSRALCIGVEDTGIGIEADALGRIFERFQQADSSVTRRYGGTGLGLVISRQLAEAMGGRLTVASRPGVGSTFTVTLPVGEAVLAAGWLEDAGALAVVPDRSIKPAPPVPPRCSGRVLVADDSPHNRQLVRMYLERMGAEVTTVADGREALAAALADPPDLVVMDMHMPVMGGLEATRRLRAEAPERIPVVALTADVVADHRARQLAAGCDDVLAKPIDRVRFHEVVCRFLAPAAPAVAVSADAAGARRRFISDLDRYLEPLAAAEAASDPSALRAALRELAVAARRFGLNPLARQAIEAADCLAAAETLDDVSDALERIRRQAALAQRAMALAG